MKASVIQSVCSIFMKLMYFYPQGIHSVDFRGDGYLLLQSEHIEFADVTNDVSLTFVTKKEDGVILVARDIPSDVSFSRTNLRQEKINVIFQSLLIFLKYYRGENIC